MCHLNILIKNKTCLKNKQDLNRCLFFLDQATQESFKFNRDGEGYYLNKKLIRSTKKINTFALSREIYVSKYILTHQRLATSAKTKEYTQPFESEEFVLMHNGILNDFLDLKKEKERSDTFLFFKKFQEKFSEKRGERTNRIVVTIKELLDNITAGFFSIAIYDKEEDVVYYFKDNITNISFFRNKDLLYITTSDSNEIYLKIFTKEYKKMKVFDFCIYKIEVKNDGIYTEKVGKIKATERVYTIFPYNPLLREQNYDIWGQLKNTEHFGGISNWNT